MTGGFRERRAGAEQVGGDECLRSEECDGVAELQNAQRGVGAMWQQGGEDSLRVGRAGHQQPEPRDDARFPILTELAVLDQRRRVERVTELWEARASAATTAPRSRGSGVVECGEVRDLAWGAGGVEGGDEPPQAALVTHSARNEEQQAVLYFG